jgi:hypothetical protein
MALDYTLDVRSKLPVPPPSPPQVDSWARGGRRSKRRADAAVSHQSEEEHLALCLLMLSRGVRGYTSENGGAAAAKASSQGYECSVCGKVYASYQALGGHKTSHRKPQPPAAASGGDEASSGGSAHAAEEEKVHKCKLCLRAFPSGQALGGHKRLHYDGGGAADGVKDNKEQPIVKAKQPSPATVLRDGAGEIAPPEAKRARMLVMV